MPNQLTQNQIKQLQTALLTAFNFDELKMMVAMQLGTDVEQANLEAIVPIQGHTLEQIIYDLIRVYAACEGGFRRLMEAAVQANGTNRLLSETVTELGAVDYAVLPLPEEMKAAGNTRQVNTAGGAAVEGNVEIERGDFVGRDKVTIVVQDVERAQEVQQQRQAQHQQRSGTFERLPFEPETILIPAGPVWIGSDDDDEHERPQHQIVLPDFRMGKYPVTNMDYAAFVKQARYEAPQRSGWFLDQPPPGKEEHPVVNVSWDDARVYCDWLTEKTGRAYRLPTEAEWEKAARGPTAQRYPWTEARKNWAELFVNTVDDTTPVDAYPAGCSPFGCFDLLGNVQEWTMTIWGDNENVNDFPYPIREPYGIDAPRNDPNASAYAGRVYRIHRGGSYRSSPSDLRVSARGRSNQTSKVRWRGFRVMMEIELAKI